MDLEGLGRERLTAMGDGRISVASPRILPKRESIGTETRTEIPTFVREAELRFGPEAGARAFDAFRELVRRHPVEVGTHLKSAGNLARFFSAITGDWKRERIDTGTLPEVLRAYLSDLDLLESANGPKRRVGLRGAESISGIGSIEDGKPISIRVDGRDFFIKKSGSTWSWGDDARASEGTLASCDVHGLGALLVALEDVTADATDNPLLAMLREEIEQAEGDALRELIADLRAIIEQREAARGTVLKELEAMIEASFGGKRVGEVPQETISEVGDLWKPTAALPERLHALGANPSAPLAEVLAKMPASLRDDYSISVKGEKISIQSKQRGMERLPLPIAHAGTGAWISTDLRTLLGDTPVDGTPVDDWDLDGERSVLLIGAKDGGAPFALVFSLTHANVLLVGRTVEEHDIYELTRAHAAAAAIAALKAEKEQERANPWATTDIEHAVGEERDVITEAMFATVRARIDALALKRLLASIKADAAQGRWSSTTERELLEAARRTGKSVDAELSAAKTLASTVGEARARYAALPGEMRSAAKESGDFTLKKEEEYRACAKTSGQPVDEDMLRAVRFAAYDKKFELVSAEFKASAEKGVYETTKCSLLEIFASASKKYTAEDAKRVVAEAHKAAAIAIKERITSEWTQQEQYNDRLRRKGHNRPPSPWIAQDIEQAIKTSAEPIHEGVIDEVKARINQIAFDRLSAQLAREAERGDYSIFLDPQLREAARRLGKNVEAEIAKLHRTAIEKRVDVVSKEMQDHAKSGIFPDELERDLSRFARMLGVSYDRAAIEHFRRLAGSVGNARTRHSELPGEMKDRAERRGEYSATLEQEYRRFAAEAQLPVDEAMLAAVRVLAFDHKFELVRAELNVDAEKGVFEESKGRALESAARGSKRYGAADATKAIAGVRKKAADAVREQIITGWNNEIAYHDRMQRRGRVTNPTPWRIEDIEAAIKSIGEPIHTGHVPTVKARADQNAFDRLSATITADVERGSYGFGEEAPLREAARRLNKNVEGWLQEQRKTALARVQAKIFSELETAAGRGEWLGQRERDLTHFARALRLAVDQRELERLRALSGSMASALARYAELPEEMSAYVERHGECSKAREQEYRSAASLAKKSVDEKMIAALGARAVKRAFELLSADVAADADRGRVDVSKHAQLSKLGNGKGEKRVAEARARAAEVTKQSMITAWSNEVARYERFRRRGTRLTPPPWIQSDIEQAIPRVGEPIHEGLIALVNQHANTMAYERLSAQVGALGLQQAMRDHQLFAAYREASRRVGK